MATALPASSEFTGAAQDEGDMKAVFTALRDYLSGLFGADGVTATAMATLGVALSSYVAKTANYTVLTTDKGKLIDATSGTWTLTLLPAATAGDAFNVSIRNSSTGVITVDPNLTETIDGGSTLAINAGESAVLYCNGTAWVSVGKSSGVPSGSITGYGGSSAPAGWLLCDGSAVSRTTYASLFSAISTTFGVGDGSTTFNIPDLRGRVLAGQDDMGGSAAGRLTTAGGGVDGATLGAVGGAEGITLTAAQSGLPSHSHSLTPITGLTGAGGGSADLNSGVYVSGSTGSSTGSTGGSAASTAHANVQPTLVANSIIKT